MDEDNSKQLQSLMEHLDSIPSVKPSRKTPRLKQFSTLFNVLRKLKEKLSYLNQETNNGNCRTGLKTISTAD